MEGQDAFNIVVTCQWDRVAICWIAGNHCSAWESPKTTTWAPEGSPNSHSWTFASAQKVTQPSCRNGMSPAAFARSACCGCSAALALEDFQRVEAPIPNAVRIRPKHKVSAVRVCNLR